MSYDLREFLKVRSINKKEITKVFEDENYNTSTLFSRTVSDGYEIITGVFSSNRKLTEQERLEEIENNKEYCVYNSNNNSDNNYINNISRFNSLIESNSQNNQNNNGIIQYENNILNNLQNEYIHNNNKISSKFHNFIYITIITIITLLLLDLCYYFFTIRSEYNIEREKCIKEYIQNECDKINMNDGPILNEFCLQKQKCYEVKFSKVYFHSILSRFLQDLFGGLFGNLFEGLISIQSGVIIIILIIVYRLIIK